MIAWVLRVNHRPSHSKTEQKRRSSRRYEYGIDAGVHLRLSQVDDAMPSCGSQLEYDTTSITLRAMCFTKLSLINSTEHLVELAK